MNSSKIKLDINERFVQACARGDYITVNFILNSIKDFNIEVTDNLDKSALKLAIANENIEVFLFFYLSFNRRKFLN